MQSLRARVASFQKTKRVKRYPNKPSSTTASIVWPHPPDYKANVDTLAEAGFFFSPSWDDRDSVECFLCGKELSDWDADDDPFEIHYTKCQSSCAWAMVRCGLTEDLDNRGCFVFTNKKRLPSSKAMEKARLKTFGQDWWPHDGELGHGATSVKMAQAGFVYTPQEADDDTVTCLYCNLSLGGWEADDDPVQEHRRRSSKSGATCPFLAFSGQQSEDELATVQVVDPPRARPKRGKARPTTSTVPSKPRRKPRAPRGKSVRAAAPVSRRSPSPSQTISCQPDSAAAPDASINDHVSPAGDPTLRSDASSPRHSNEIRQDSSTPYHAGSMHPLPDQPVSPPAPSALSKHDASLDTAVDHPNSILSLSPAGQPIITNSQVLTDHERKMSLEQWIRQEISLSYERLLNDGRRQIEIFRTRAAELRKCIDEL